MIQSQSAHRQGYATIKIECNQGQKVKKEPLMLLNS